MPKFVFAYHGGKKPETPEEGEMVMAAWNAWFSDMGEAVVDPGHPVGMSTTVSSSGTVNDGGTNPVSGISYVSAKDISEAASLAKGCPIITDGGSVEIAEVLSM